MGSTSKQQGKKLHTSKVPSALLIKLEVWAAISKFPLYVLALNIYNSKQCGVIYEWFQKACLPCKSKKWSYSFKLQNIIIIFLPLDKAADTNYKILCPIVVFKPINIF